MQKLKFKNAPLAFGIAIAGLAAAVGISFLKIEPFSLPVPLLIIGIFAGFTVASFLTYPQATTKQTLQLGIIGFSVNAALLAASIFAVNYLKKASITIDSDFILSINPSMPLISFICAFAALAFSVGFEAVSLKPHPLQASETPKSDEKITLGESVKKEPPSFEPKEKIEEKPKSTYEELYPQPKKEVEPAPAPEQKTEEVFFSISDVKDKLNDAPPAEKSLQAEEFFELSDLGPLHETAPNVEKPQSQEQKQEEASAPKTSQGSGEGSNYDFIPTDIRLVEAPTPKEHESKGKIGSIGGLLVNKRDIEGVIESNINIPEGAQGHRAGVFSSVSGEEVNEKFRKLKESFPHIKELALIDKGGFILAGIYEDKMKIQITGALISGAYLTMQNYLSQIGFKTPLKILFETENSNNSIIKMGEELLFMIMDKEFIPVDYGMPNTFKEDEEFSDTYFTPLVELNQIKDYAVSDSVGNLVKGLNMAGTSERMGLISSALFENFKVFLMNIQLVKLSGITIFNEEEVMSIRKCNDQIVSFITPVDGIVQESTDFLKVKEVC